MKKLIATIFTFIIITNSQSQISNPPTIDSATMYLTGTFKTYNPTKAFNLFLQRAITGDAKAMNAVALLYSKGIGTDSNFNNAIIWFNNAIQNNYTKSIVNKGMLYKHCFADSFGYTTAFNLFNTAVLLNEPSAFFAQGYMYFKGLGCNQSYTNALQLFKLGINSNNAACMYFTGLCYANGYGVTTNTDSANYYINNAALLGYKQANEVLAYTSNTSSTAKHSAPNNKDQRPNIKEQELIQIPKTTKQINLTGTYQGFINQYDYSGKHVLKQTKLALNLFYENNSLVGNWIQNDSIHIPITATQQNNTVFFGNMQINEPKNPNQRATKQQQTILQFQKAVFQLQQSNDSTMLFGNLNLFNNYQNEPDKPIYLTLLKQNQNTPIVATNNVINSLIVYPNPTSNIFKITFNATNKTNANISLYTQKGNLVYQTTQSIIQGKQTLLVNTNLANGIYVLKITTPTQTISRVIIKTN